jgi:hypothetical protein
MHLAAPHNNSRTGNRLGHCLLALSLAISATPARPQSLSSSQATTIGGTITDVTGALIPCAVVSLSMAGSSTLQTTTDSKGHFALDATPGQYILKASAPGYEVFRETVHLTAATPTVENISLGVGAITCPIMIEGNTVEVSNASLDLLLPFTPLPPFHLSAKRLKHLQR